MFQGREGSQYNAIGILYFISHFKAVNNRTKAQQSGENLLWGGRGIYRRAGGDSKASDDEVHALLERGSYARPQDNNDSLLYILGNGASVMRSFHCAVCTTTGFAVGRLALRNVSVRVIRVQQCRTFSLTT